MASRRGPARADPLPPTPSARPGDTGPPPTVRWTKRSGPGNVTFADATALTTTAAFSATGVYVLELTAHDGDATASSTLRVKVESPPPVRQLDVVHMRKWSVDSPLWNHRMKALIVSWIPHCVEQLERTDVTAGGIDNFIEAGKKLRGEPSGAHKGYVFANAYVHNAVEAMSIALMLDDKGDPEIIRAHADMRATLDRWIPIILAAQEPDGYLQTAFTLPRVSNAGGNNTPGPFLHWERRADHEGYTAGYFIESAIAHYLMTDGKDPRLYNAAKKLADCWSRNLGPAPKKAWYDGHQEMEQALVRFGRFVNDVEGGGKGDNGTSSWRKFLLDIAICRAERSRAVGIRSEPSACHRSSMRRWGTPCARSTPTRAWRMSPMETHDPDYQSAVKSIWDNIVNKKYLRHRRRRQRRDFRRIRHELLPAQQRLLRILLQLRRALLPVENGLAYHDATYADLYEETLYNAILGGLDLDGQTSTTPIRSMRRSPLRRGTTAPAAWGTFRARC